MSQERSEKRADYWTEQDDKDLAKLLKEQAEKDKQAEEAQKEKDKDGQQ